MTSHELVPLRAPPGSNTPPDATVGTSATASERNPSPVPSANPTAGALLANSNVSRISIGLITPSTDPTPTKTSQLFRHPRPPFTRDLRAKRIMEHSSSHCTDVVEHNVCRCSRALVRDTCWTRYLGRFEKRDWRQSSTPTRRQPQLRAVSETDAAVGFRTKRNRT